MPIDATIGAALSGSEWQIPGISPIAPEAGAPGVARAGEGADAAAAAGGAGAGGQGGGFGDVLAGQIEKLAQGQREAAGASKALATGQAEDVSQVVMSVERAKMSMQLAATLRSKATEAYHEIFRTQV